MALSETEISEIEHQLYRVAPALATAFRESMDHLPPSLAEDKLRLWLDEGTALAAHSLRSWEAGVEYFRSSVSLIGEIDEAVFRNWVAVGKDLMEMAPPIAAAFYKASPSVLPRLAGAQVREWAMLSERLYKATWKSISLASELLNKSPRLLDFLSLAELTRLSQVIGSIADRSADLAAGCMEAAPETFARLEAAERSAFIDFAMTISDSAWPEASLYFQKGPDLISGVDKSQRPAYLELASAVARRLGRPGYSLFAEGAVALRHIEHWQHKRLLELSGLLVQDSAVAAMSFLQVAPRLLERLQPKDIDTWHAAGLEVLKQSLDGGEAYFRLESGRAEETAQALSSRVDLTRVAELLRLYGKALTGTNISVQPVTSLEEKGIGWVSERGPSTEGTAVYLPDYISLYDNKTDNFSVYKVYATHQTAHIEFGSFNFLFNRAGVIAPSRRPEVESQQRIAGVVTKSRWVTDMERFFDLFVDRQLAADIFTISEDLRIDSHVADQYMGIRRANQRAHVLELARRPDVKRLPLRQAFVENLIRASLDGEYTIEWPANLRSFMVQGVNILTQLRDPLASVEDAAEITINLYDIAHQIPNLPPEQLNDPDWQDMGNEGQGGEPQEAGENILDQMPEGDESPYDSPEQVDYRGDFKPEMVQLLMRMRTQQVQAEDESELSPLTEEQIKELLEKSVEIDKDWEEDFEWMKFFEEFLENLEEEAGLDVPTDEELQAEPSDSTDDDGEEPPAPPAPKSSLDVKLYYYDEWDFRASDYKPRWCTVRERYLEEGTTEYYEKVLREHSSLVAATQRQFELLKPETFRKIKRLEDGEDIDLDAALEFIVQRKAGHGDVQKIYWRRNKVERDVAVAFLLDMSASTDEEIEKRKPRTDTTQQLQDPRRAWGAGVRGATGLIEPPKRIIDLEKESLVLLTRALETIGDRYAIYGFSGYGRENIEFYIVKDFEEPFEDDIRQRIDKVSPIRSTRMGPAIRHTAKKLMETDAKARILFLVSDGRPQDHGYGRDRTEKEYAMNDTHKALLEAKYKGIVPFALTVDKEGHDYLGQMCGDIGYEVVSDIETLPSRLPTLYRRLTETRSS